LSISENDAKMEEDRDIENSLSRHINLQLSMDSVPEQEEPMEAMAQTMRYNSVNNASNTVGCVQQQSFQVPPGCHQVQQMNPPTPVHAMSVVNNMQPCMMPLSDSFKLKQLNAVPTNNTLAAAATARGQMKIAMIDDSNVPVNTTCSPYSEKVLNTKKMTDEEEHLEHLESFEMNVDDPTTLKEFLRVLQEYPEFQLNEDQLANLEIIENPPDHKLAELLIDQDSGHGLQ
jgi:hypothetical protein